MGVGVFTGGQNNFGVAGDAGWGTPPTLCTLRCRFKNLTGEYANPSNPFIRFIAPNSNECLTLDVIGSVLTNGRYSVVQDPSDVGLFSFSFLCHGLKEGLYNIEWGGEFADGDGKVHTTLIKGQIAIGEINRVQDFINRVRDRLFDDHFVDYRLDEPVRQFPDKNLFQYLRDAVSRFNSTGPRRTSYDFNTFPPDIDELLVTGGVIWALYGRARLEKANELNYSDLHTLNIQRADFYKSMADGLLQDWQKAIESWKKATPPSLIGEKSQRMPFRMFRVIGMLPNYKSYFSG